MKSKRTVWEDKIVAAKKGKEDSDCAHKKWGKISFSCRNFSFYSFLYSSFRWHCLSFRLFFLYIPLSVSFWNISICIFIHFIHSVCHANLISPVCCSICCVFVCCLFVCLFVCMTTTTATATQSIYNSVIFVYCMQFFRRSLFSDSFIVCLLFCHWSNPIALSAYIRIYRH